MKANITPKVIKALLVSGMIAPSLFVLLFTLEGFFTPHYNPLSMYVSELSIGPGGWMQIMNFIITGTLLVLFSVGVKNVLDNTKLANVGSILLLVIGLCLVVSGPLVTDPSTIFEQKSLHGFLHGIFGALVFSLAPITCFIFYTYFKKEDRYKRFAHWTLTAGIVIVASVVLMKAGQAPDTLFNPWVGLIQRVALITYMGWVFTFALELYKNQRH